MAEDSGLTPYQQRQMAQLATCSDYAVCRGAKRGAPEHQLCPCGQRKRENTGHALLECPLYEGLRGPLDRTMREHTALASAGRARLRDGAAGGAAVGYR